ncbi:transcriptional regulator, SarA/Rot family [Mammaliicoccus stepanovicii]|uniref:Accessory regulator R n=1 Tax=Mammaliicoccus stepanovicii TaxID=643214 RepID=A0A239YID6_9STAP|nr:hypothetical protein [Mammaliicoccus stepanovicii]PNZ74200.1 hypothetical protein CD111_09090 [Mammaliicoccus stepanovicii]GGI40887.1 hypothetical protein GCM10010896_10610 [Mammaliicoccus stepanovicii]SNV58472.1 accessory regulator R [Mammaliicoccus stepanovicii]
MCKTINDLLSVYLINNEVIKFLKNKYDLSIYHLKILKYINLHHDEEAIIEVKNIKRDLDIHHSIVTTVISDLHNLNYFIKKRSKNDERKILLIVETRHKMKIAQFIHDIKIALKEEFAIQGLHLNYDHILEDVIRNNVSLMNIKKVVKQKYKFKLDQFLLLMLIMTIKHDFCTFKEIKRTLSWDMAKINKAVKVLVKMNYVNKNRDKLDERKVSLSINERYKDEIYMMLEDVSCIIKAHNGDSNLAMLK